MNGKISRSRQIGISLLNLADIGIDGKRPWDIVVHDDRFFHRVLSQGALGLGESYMDGWWDCEAIDQLITRLLRADLEAQVRGNFMFALYLGLSRIINFQSQWFAPEVGRVHYDIDAEIYRHMLDAEMNYSCAVWDEATTLDEAQRAKLDLCCRKLGLQPGMRLLDIGCGWGAMARHASTQYGTTVVGITISAEQAKLAAQLCRGLPIDIRHQDYRDITGSFDRVVSIGMFEHVGHRNYRQFMKCVDRLLTDDGLFLLHTMGVTGDRHGIDPWVIKYIFPHAVLPTMAQICDACANRFILQDWQNLGRNYITTLHQWRHNFNYHWPVLASRHDERFRRMWNYFLLYFAGGFAAGHIQLWQVLWSKPGAGTIEWPLR